MYSHVAFDFIDNKKNCLTWILSIVQYIFVNVHCASENPSFHNSFKVCIRFPFFPHNERIGILLKFMSANCLSYSQAKKSGKLKIDFHIESKTNSKDNIIVRIISTLNLHNEWWKTFVVYVAKVVGEEVNYIILLLNGMSTVKCFHISS